MCLYDKATSYFRLQLCGPNSWPSSWMSCRRKPRLGITPLFCFTAQMASTRARFCLSMRYARTTVAERLTPTWQWTSTLPEKQRETESEICNNADVFISTTKSLYCVYSLLTSSAESHVNKVCCGLEVDAHVKPNGVMSFYTHIGDPHALIDIWLSSAFTVSCIQDVSDSVSGEISTVLCTVSVENTKLLIALIVIFGGIKVAGVSCWSISMQCISEWWIGTWKIIWDIWNVTYPKRDTCFYASP